MKKQNFNIKIIGIISLMLFAGYISWNFYFAEYNAKDTVDIHLFPKTIGPWESEELTITEEEFAILETRNAFARKYLTKSGKQVVLYIIYSESNRKVSHPPELCYTGSGLTILNKEYVPVVVDEQEVEAAKLLFEQGRAQQYVYYWFKVGSSFTPSYWKQQLLIALKSLFGQPTSSALIRVSADIRNGDKSKAEQDVEEFIQVIFSKLPSYLP